MNSDGDSPNPLAKKLLGEGIYAWYYSLRYLRPRGPGYLEPWTPDRIETDKGWVNPYLSQSDGLEARVERPKSGERLINRLFKPFFRVGGIDRWPVRSGLGWRLASRWVKKNLRQPGPPRDGYKPSPPLELETDLLIIGGGISGLHAALSAVGKGVKPLILEMDYWLGGRRPLYNPEDRDGSSLERLGKMVEARGARILRRTVFQGFHEDGVYAYDWSNGRAVYIRYRALILATGFYENPPLAENIDLPGSMPMGSFLKMVKRMGLEPPRRIVLFGLDRWVTPVKEFLESLGGEPVVISFNTLDPKKDRVGYRLRLEGREKVERVRFWRGDEEQVYETDLFLYAYEMTANSWVSMQTGMTHVYVYGLGGYIPWHDIEGRTEREEIFIAGACGGVYTTEYDVYSGLIAGLSAAEYLGMDVEEDRKKYVAEVRKMLDNDPLFDKLMGSVYRRESVIPAKTRRFYSDEEEVVICPCLDVSLADLRHSIERLGYVDIDLIKRYSGLATGRCQGKICLSNTLKYLHEVHGGVIRNLHHRIRPPYMPHPLGIFMGEGGEAEA